MSERPHPIPSHHTVWGIPLIGMRCPHCDRRYFIRQGTPEVRCPHCFQAHLTPLGDATPHLPYHAPPELVCAFSLNPTAVEQHLNDFARDIPFAPPDLNAKTLRNRLQRLYLPQWLVDGDVHATWEAEVGFDYEVVSYQEYCNDANQEWTTEKTTQTRIRWETRIGQLERHYDNITAPALDDDTALQRILGPHRPHTAHAYTPASLSDGLIRLPDRPPQDAWSDAALNFQRAAAIECQHAAQADHIRHYRWSPTYTHLNWTQRLCPVYTTYYVGDEGTPYPIFIHGQTGQLSGIRQASMQRAQRLSIIIAIIAAVLLVIGLCLIATGLIMPPILIVGLIIIVLTLGGGAIGALSPILIAKRFNRKNH